MHCADNERFVTIRGARRIWAVGSLHGDAERLRALHEQIGERFEQGDRIVYLGNYLGWGERIVETVDQLLRFRRAILAVPNMRACDVVYLRGSQEEMWQKLLQLQLAVEPANAFAWMMEHGVRATLRAYGGDEEVALRHAKGGARDLARWTSELSSRLRDRDGHREFMSNLRRAAFTADGGLLFVHAGIDVTRPLDAQKDTFWWGTAEGFDLKESYGGYKKVIRGYDPDHAGVVFNDYCATIDCGAGFGGFAAAVCLSPDGEPFEQLEA